MNNSVIFKGNSNGIVVILDNNISFEELKNVLTKKVINSRKFFEGVNTSICFKGRKMSDDEQIDLLNIISSNTGLEISFITEHDSPIPRISPKKDILESPVQKINYSNIDTQLKSNTFYQNGSIRNGQSINFSGSVIVLGDVNPGGEIKAEGNIIVLGKLKGLAHAGCKGDKKAFVSALFMNPTQLIISDIITYFPQDLNRSMSPEYAYIKDNEIYIEQLITY